MKAWLGLREGVHYRRAAFAAGLEANGFTVVHGVTTKPGPRDVLCIWNRYRENAVAADRFEGAGRPVLVAENGYLGNEFAGDRWYAISLSQHNGAGRWPVGGPQRWDGLGVTSASWRGTGGEIVLLPQRGIGPPGVGMPATWPGRTRDYVRSLGLSARIRPHPGIGKSIPLEQDLTNASAVVTWGSGAALKALLLGIPVFSQMPEWIGREAAAPLSGLANGSRNCDSGARTAMFRRLAWAQWRLSEIEDGSAFRAILAAVRS